MKWELKDLENAVRKAHGDQYASAIHEPLQSFSWKSSMAYFHAYEAEQILKEAIAATPGIDGHDPPSFATAMAVIFAAAPGDAGQALRLARFKAEAHIISSAQALHSLCDIVCHAVYWAYQLDTVPKAPETKRLNLYSMLRTLSRLPQYATTESLIQAIVDAPEFTYLAAYVNTTKHKSLVNASMSASLDAEGRCGMQIDAFSYTDPIGNYYRFDSKWAYDFLFPENQSIRLKLMAVGNSLNAHFRIRRNGV
jgi:hypothetical protein